MTGAEIRDWALANGFAAQRGGGKLTSPYRGGHVVLEFLTRTVRVSMERDGNGMRIGTFDPAMARLNELGVVDGIGLGMTFAHGFVSSDPGAERPSWMSEAYLAAIGVRPAPDASDAPRP